MKLAKKLGLGLSAVVILLSTILTLLLAPVPTAPHVGAQASCPGNDSLGPINRNTECLNHPYEAAQIYQAYWAFWHCAQGEWRTGQPISQLRDADLFFRSSGQYRPTYIRASDNRPGNCHNAANIEPMFSDMGIDPFTYLTTDTGSGPIYTADGTSYNVNGNVSIEARVAHLANMIRDQHQLDVTSGIARAAQQYFVVKAHFKERCIEDDNVPTTAGGTAVRMVSNDGTEETVNVLVRSRNDDGVGYGLNGNDASSNSTGAQISCADMANLMNTYADIAIQRIAEWRDYNPDAEIPADEAGGTEEQDNSCESAGGTLGWIMCPIAGLLDSVVGFLDENIRNLLYVDQNYFDTGEESGSALKVAWSQFRNIAYIILIPIMLVMVIGTALGFEVFSAYTIKKALPRMVIAVIFITLSWYICVFLVNFFNIIGGGITNIVTAPFSDIHSAAGESSRSPLKGALDAAGITQAGDGWVQSVASGTAATTLGIVGTVGLFAAGALSLGIIMSTLATAALILGGIFLLLIVRQMLVIGLALLAPLAILAWIFPGNDKMWKLWWGSFSKLLMLYPLITLLIGVGQVFAYVTGVARVGDNQLVTVIIIIGSFLMPFFFIPFAFKWAGGVFGNLAGMVNDRERGLLDRLRKGRENMRGRHMADAKNFGRFKGNNVVTKRLNDLGGMATNRPGAWSTPGRLAGTRAAGQTAKAAEDLKNDKVYQANQNNDKFLLALANRQHAEAERDAARAEDDEQSAAAWDSALGAAGAVKTKDMVGTKLAAIQAHAATGYNLAAGQRGYNQLADSVIKAMDISEQDVNRDANGNILGVTGSKAGMYAEAMNGAQFGLKNAGRYDLGGINNGTGYSAEIGLGKASLYQLANGKKQAITTMVQELGDGPLGGALGEKAATVYTELQAMKPNATGAVAAEIDEQMAALERRGVRDFMRQPSGRMEQVPGATPGTQRPATREQRVNYDASNPAHKGWSADEQRRGWRIEREIETMADVVQSKARTYQRPDPNNLD